MNLRQKCKKLKRENGRLKKQMSATLIHRPLYREDCRKYQKVAVKKILNKHEEEIPLEVIERNMTLELADGLYPYMNFENYRDILTGYHIVEASVDIVVLDKREVGV